MSELVERVARALKAECESSARTLLPGWEKDRHIWIKQARAAILAMREPSEAMLRGFGNGKALRARAKLQWRAMIDAELGEQ